MVHCEIHGRHCPRGLQFVVQTLRCGPDEQVRGGIGFGRLNKYFIVPPLDPERGTSGGHFNDWLCDLDDREVIKCGLQMHDARSIAVFHPKLLSNGRNQNCREHYQDHQNAFHNLRPYLFPCFPLPDEVQKTPGRVCWMVVVNWLTAAAQLCLRKPLAAAKCPEKLLSRRALRSVRL